MNTLMYCCTHSVDTSDDFPLKRKRTKFLKAQKSDILRFSAFVTKDCNSSAVIHDHNFNFPEWYF